MMYYHKLSNMTQRKKQSYYTKTFTKQNIEITFSAPICLHTKARKPPSKIIKVHGYQSHLLTINLGFEIMYSID